MEKSPAVYILSSKMRGTLYIGVTANLQQRIWQHKQKYVEGFSHEYNVDSLVYYEMTPDMNSAIQREKQLKNWKRSWKIQLIESINNEWKDLYDDLF